MPQERKPSYKDLFGAPSADRLHMQRNLSYAAAGTLVANLLLLVQLGQRDTPLQISMFASVICLPIWIFLATFFEVYLLKGPRSYSHLDDQLPLGSLLYCFAIAGLGLYVAIAGIVWHLSSIAGLCLVASTVMAMILSWRHGNSLRKHLEE